MGKILLNDMGFVARHGACDHEYLFDQKFKVDVEVDTLAVERAGATDDLLATINYAEIFALVEGIMGGQHCALIETLAYRIGHQIINEFPAADGVEVQVRKLNPPIANFNGSAAVSFKLSRQEASR